MESLSIHLQPFLDWLVRTTLQASLLIGLILLLQTALRTRLGVRWNYCLWLVLLARMAMPWMPESRISLFNLGSRSFVKSVSNVLIIVPQRQFQLELRL